MWKETNQGGKLLYCKMASRLAHGDITMIGRGHFWAFCETCWAVGKRLGNAKQRPEGGMENRSISRFLCPCVLVLRPRAGRLLGGRLRTPANRMIGWQVPRSIASQVHSAQRYPCNALCVIIMGDYLLGLSFLVRGKSGE